MFAAGLGGVRRIHKSLRKDCHRGKKYVVPYGNPISAIQCRQQLWSRACVLSKTGDLFPCVRTMQSLEKEDWSRLNRQFQATIRGRGLRVKLNLANDQLDTQFFYYIYYNLLHVSSNILLIIRRSHCINRLKTKRRPIYLNIQPVPRCKHFSSRL